MTKNQGICDLSKYLRAEYSEQIKTFEDISKSVSNKKLVDNKTEAFDFDEIIKKLFNDRYYPRSVDALFINNSIYLIEFKRSIPKKTEHEKNPKTIIEEVKNKILASCIILEKLIMNECKVDRNMVNISFIFVIDDESYKNFKNDTIGQIGRAFATLGDGYETDFYQSFKAYICMTKSNKHIFLNDVKIWKAPEFTKKLNSLSK